MKHCSMCRSAVSTCKEAFDSFVQAVTCLESLAQACQFPLRLDSRIPGPQGTSSKLIVFGCGHVYHDQCLTKMLEAQVQISTFSFCFGFLGFFRFSRATTSAVTPRECGRSLYRCWLIGPTLVCWFGTLASTTFDFIFSLVLFFCCRRPR